MTEHELNKMRAELNALHERYDKPLNHNDSVSLNAFIDIQLQSYEHVPEQFQHPGTFRYIPGMYKVFKKGENRYAPLNESITTFNNPELPNFVMKQLWADGLMNDITDMSFSKQFDNNCIPGHIMLTINRSKVTNSVYHRLMCIMKHCGYYLAYADQVLFNDIHSAMFQFEPYFWGMKHEESEHQSYIAVPEEHSNIKENIIK